MINLYNLHLKNSTIKIDVHLFNRFSHDLVVRLNITKMHLVTKTGIRKSKLFDLSSNTQG